jgi:diguanylate cyclase (GGDEF)-like protein/PAS domain S-box-containing protein
MHAGADDAFAGDVAADSVEHRYRQLLDHSPDPMCVHVGGRVVYVNPAGLTGIGASHPDQLVGHSIAEFVHPDSVGPMLARIAGLTLDGDSSEPAEAVMLRVDGGTLDAEVVSVLTRWDGEPAYQVIFRDLTTLKAAQATLRYQAALVAHATDAIIATSSTGAVTSWNRAAETIYHRLEADVVGVPIGVAVGADVDPVGIVAGGGVQRTVHRTANGTPLDIRVAVAAMDDGFVLVCSDHTALRRAERRLETIVATLDEGVIVVDARGSFEFVNPAAELILGWPDGPPPDLRAADARFTWCDADGEPAGSAWQLIGESLAAKTPVRNLLVRHDRPDGVRQWLTTTCRALDPAEDGTPVMLIAFVDTTEQHAARMQLAHQARHDALTGLPNRAYLESRTARALAAEPTELAAVMFVDLDNVKTVNDAHGHHAGDVVIRTAAERLRAAVRREDFVARHGGDEFVVLVIGRTDRAALDDLAGRLHRALAESIDLVGTRHVLTASIGVVEVSPDDSRDGSQLLRAADAAMYEAKKHRDATHYDGENGWAATPQDVLGTTLAD